jgi:hypothetical protein
MAYTLPVRPVHELVRRVVVAVAGGPRGHRAVVLPVRVPPGGLAARPAAELPHRRLPVRADRRNENAGLQRSVIPTDGHHRPPPKTTSSPWVMVQCSAYGHRS